MLTEQQFDSGDITIHFAVGPATGPALLLLHGFMDRWQSFVPIVPTLAARWRLFAPDMRGHGGTTRAPDGVYRRSDLAADLIAFLDGVVDEPAVLLGHSAGTFAATEVAARCPDICRGVVVGDMLFDLPYLTNLVAQPESIEFHREIQTLAGRPSSEILRHLARSDPDGDAAVWGEQAASLSQLDPRAVDSHVAGRLTDLMGDLDGDALLRAITSPTLLLQADPHHGGVMTDAYVTRALALLRHGRHVRLDGVGHNLGLDTGNVTPLVSALVPFLESI